MERPAKLARQLRASIRPSDTSDQPGTSDQPSTSVEVEDVQQTAMHEDQPATVDFIKAELHVHFSR